MSRKKYVHGYTDRESGRLNDPAQTLTRLLHSIHGTLRDPGCWKQEIRDLYRTSRKDGVFCNTFFKAKGKRI